MKGKTVFDLFDPKDVPLIKEEIKRDMNNGESIIPKYQVKGKKKDHSMIDLQLLYYKKQDDSTITISLLDITDQKRNERQLSLTYRELEDVKFALDKSTTVSITDLNGDILYVNDLFCEISQYEREELIGQNHRIVNSKYHSKEYFQQMWTTIKSGHIWKGEVCNKAKDETIWWADATIIPFLDEEGNPFQYIAVRSDITKRKKMEEEIHHMAYYDFLTNLPNKTLFESRFEQKYEQARKINNEFYLLILHLNGIRFVNHSLGTEMGDQLLKEAALHLNRFFNQNETLSRLEGNEFALTFLNTSNEDIQKIAEDIIQLFEQPFCMNEYELYLTANIGISTYPDSGDTVRSLMKNAYSALNQAKKIGVNNYQIFSPSMDIGSYKRFMLKNDLRKAVKNNEFFLVYQPRIDPRTNHIIGAEALIRWEHPKWGVVSPNEFILLAEEEGLIVSIGERVLLYACQQNKAWQEAGLTPITISVNFSVHQFLQTNMIEMVDGILKRTGLDSKWLEIEITETVLMKDEPTVFSKIERLKKMNIKIAIDDFGTGYAALSSLKKLKANTLKIDRSFIIGIPHESDSSEIVSAIIHLAQKLKIRTVAKGVETVEQLNLLKKINCDEIQGYLYSRPITIQDFERLLRRKVCVPSQTNQLEDIQIENRRKFFRIDLFFPMRAEMTISELAGKKIKLGSTKVLIVNIGPGGIEIETNIKLPVRSDLKLQFTTELFGENLELSGTIVWNRERHEDYQSYGIRFILEDKPRSHLTYLLNQLQLKLRQSSLIPDCSFVLDDRRKFFST